jgi:EamA domain-containing membrane protein RarD
VLVGDMTTFWLYAGAAPVTLLPLVFFALAVERTTLTMIGLTQYIEPSLQFVLAVFIFGEVLDQVKVVSFGFIWIGLILCTVEALVFSRLSMRQA